MANSSFVRVVCIAATGLILGISSAACTDGTGASPQDDRNDGFRETTGEKLPPVDCPGECFVVEPNSTYCSVDATALPHQNPLASKSEIHIAEGSYTLSGTRLESFPKVRVVTAGLDVELGEPQESTATYIPEVVEDGWIFEYEGIDLRASYNAPLAIDELLLKARRWPNVEYRLGDPTNVDWFFRLRRNIFIKPSRDEIELPVSVVHFAPCDLKQGEASKFAFAFADGSRITVETRTVNGVVGLGYSLGRATRASGTMWDEAFEIQSHFDLGYFGSDSQSAELALPSFVLRSEFDDARVCGVVLDSTAWDAPSAVGGYHAFELACDGNRGLGLALASVDYDRERFVEH